MNDSQIWRRVQGRYQRFNADLFCRRPLRIRTDVPIISFTFDDFPRSALSMGGAILKRYGQTGTYYVSCGLMGSHGPGGAMLTREDIETLLRDGHELGCHTYDHLDSWASRPDQFEESIVKNQRALSKMCPGAAFKTFAYPISLPRPQNKKRAERYFACCRCGGQKYNVKRADGNYLCSFFLEQSRDNPEAVRGLIEESCAAKGWLIFSTHDISETPSPWGCTPGYFENVVRWSADSGARILPVYQAWQVLSAQMEPQPGTRSVAFELERKAR